MQAGRCRQTPALTGRSLPLEHTCSEGRFRPAAGSPGYSASAAGKGPPTPSVRLRLLTLAAGANWPVAVRATAAPAYALGAANAVQCRLLPRCRSRREVLAGFWPSVTLGTCWVLAQAVSTHNTTSLPAGCKGRLHRAGCPAATAG
jgi:hypothetical protein